MIATLIICVTVIVCLVLILNWAKDMSTAQLPMFTYAECVRKESTDSVPSNVSIGFVTSEEETTGKKTDKEIRDELAKDPITLCASLLRGEVDVDDITN